MTTSPDALQLHGSSDFSPSRAVLALAEQAIRDFALIKPGDRVAVGLSGGKDSFLLAVLLREMTLRDDMDFEVHGVHLDQHQPGFDRQTFDRSLELLDIDCTVVSEDTHSIVQEKLPPGKIPCAMCSRLRRGILNQWCLDQGFTKLALGHHLDDAIETFFLNLLFGRRLEPLTPLRGGNETQVSVIRPLILVEERKIEGWVTARGVPTVDCPVCDSFPQSRRRDLKEMIDRFSELQPNLRASVRHALYER